MRGGRPAVLLVLAALLAGCTQAPATPAPAPPTFPEPSGTVAQVTSRPVQGHVVVENGPFTDRVTISELSLSPSPAAVTGRLLVTTDVSDLLLLELRCTFYDEHGAVVGTGSFQHSHSHEGHEEHGADEHVDFRLQLDPPGRASAAVLSVPALVNE